MAETAIIVICYNRIHSLARLLHSLSLAEYNKSNIDLIISIDKSPIQDEIYDLAKSHRWENGNLIIIKHEQRLGLKSHVLLCGGKTKEYENIILLEDDLIVSKYFYIYASQSLRTYCDCENIAGISLYKHEINPGNSFLFVADNDGTDVFFMQYAQSWGQCFTKSMWQKFESWLLVNETIVDTPDFPKYILQWGNKSWLKYFMKYIFYTNKFFVYPQISLTTNCTDSGTHNSNSNSFYQVPLLSGNKQFKFQSFEKGVKYDMFFEKIDCKLAPSLEKYCPTIDLYGLKNIDSNSGFILSTKIRDFEIVKEIGLKYRPIEINCQYPTEGKGIFLYNTNIVKKNMNRNTECYLYNVRALNWRYLFKASLVKLFLSLINRIN